MNPDITRDALAALDADDPLAFAREHFDLPTGVLYFDGNSLGAQPKRAGARIEDVRAQWRTDLINAWNDHRWIHLPTEMGGRIAPLIGARPHEVAVTDSTSVNLFKLVAAALRLRPDRRVIVSQRDNFPSNLYMMQGLIDLIGRDYELRLSDSQDVEPKIDDDVAVVCLTHVNFKSGAMHDLDAITKRAHAAGAIMVWDLSHSAGSIPIDLNTAGADLATGCGYKFLNGGPGAPSFVFVAEGLHDKLAQPLTGWLGHAAPFDFAPDYEPAPGIARVLCGTPSIVSMASLDAALEVFDGIDMQRVRAKSMALGQLFLDLVEQRCAGHGFTVECPRDAAQRGSQISLGHPEGYRIVRALIDRGVIGDFRAPNVLRFGITPLYQRHVDVWDAVDALRDVMDQEIWRDPKYERRDLVT